MSRSAQTRADNMMNIFRKLKDKTTSESDDGTGSSSSSVINCKDSLPVVRKRMKPRVLLHRLLPLEILSCKNDKSDLGNDLRAPHDTLILNSSVRIEKLSPADISPEPSFSTSTPIPFLNINSDFGDSPVRVLQGKRSSSDLEITSDSPQRKVLRSSVSR